VRLLLAEIDDCLCSYPTSLLRIISSGRLLFGNVAEGGAGLLQFLDSDPVWRFKFPATFVFYSAVSADFSPTTGRPNFFKSTDEKFCSAFASFKPLALMPQ
jgi:hypothetical protein